MKSGHQSKTIRHSVAKKKNLMVLIRIELDCKLVTTVQELKYSVCIKAKTFF